MAVWPASLPQNFLTEGQAERTPNTLLRTQMDAGPAKVRRRHSAGVRRITAPLVLTTAQVATLETFLESTLLGGSLPFEKAHTRTGVIEEFRVVPESEDTLVSYRPLGAGKWATGLQLEILP